SLVVAREWERGTMEALLSTEVTRVELLLCKLIPYYFLGMLAIVQAKMEKGAFGYIRGGAEDENNLRSNTESFDKKYIMPRVLQG
ncbi:ABC transporter permease subunit, partial [Salmonella enterica subsp. enterica serovar Anatum]|nr:ABC transporter permease subunit [Salmonella enterica subsp. enterica serovar Anatum]